MQLRFARTAPPRACLGWRYIQRPCFSVMATGVPSRKSVAVCIIGNEILRGFTLDTNSNYLARKAYLYGLDVRRLVTVPDDHETIASTVKSLAAEFDYVFTSGGIGPTHDDITYEAVASAFGLSLQLHTPTVDSMRAHHLLNSNPDSGGNSHINSPRSDNSAAKKELELTEGRLRMALLPTPHQIIQTLELWVPLVIVQSKVFVLPGVPSLFRQMTNALFEASSSPLAATLAQSPFVRRVVYTNMYEGDIADKLKEIQEGAKECNIGSYPKIGNQNYRVKVSIEGADETAVSRCAMSIRTAIDGWFDPADKGDPK